MQKKNRIATNVARTFGFNKPQVEMFYGIYRELLEQNEYEPSKIWNMDETGITCVNRPGKIVDVVRIVAF